MDVNEIATDLAEERDGLFRAATDTDVSYPRGGHDMTFEMEATSFWYQHRARCIVAATDRHPPSGPVFDVGGGTGHVASSLHAAGHDAVVVEPGPSGAEIAWRRGLRPVVNATTHAAGFRNGTLPAVGLFDVVEHIEDDVAFMRHVHDLLVPTGMVYLTVPAHQLLWSVDDVRAGHFRRYSTDGLRDLLRHTGFEVVYDTALFRPLPLPLLLVRSIPSRLGFRDVDDTDAAVRDHAGGDGLARRVMDRLLEPEVAAVEAGRRMRLGTTIMAVARRR